MNASQQLHQLQLVTSIEVFHCGHCAYHLTSSSLLSCILQHYDFCHYILLLLYGCFSNRIHYFFNVLLFVIVFSFSSLSYSHFLSCHCDIWLL